MFDPQSGGLMIATEHGACMTTPLETLPAMKP